MSEIRLLTDFDLIEVNCTSSSSLSLQNSYYPSPGIDFEVSGVKFDGAGFNSRRGGVGSL